MIDGLSDLDMKILIFTLPPSFTDALSNRGSRELTADEKTRVNHHYAIKLHAPSFGEVIDNSKLKPEETADVILERINKLNK